MLKAKSSKKQPPLVRLDRDSHRTLHKLAELEERPMSVVLRRAVETYRLLLGYASQDVEDPSKLTPAELATVQPPLTTYFPKERSAQVLFDLHPDLRDEIRERGQL